MADEEKTIKFNEIAYTEAGLKTFEIPALLELRNEVAVNLGVARISSFKNHDQAVQTAWKALEKWSTGDGAAKPAKPAKPVKLSKEPKILGPAKCGFSQTIKRPTRNMFRTLTKIRAHPGEHFRMRRWENYKDGMTLLDTAEGDDMTQLDVVYYVSHGLMSLTEPTDEAYEAGLAAWYQKHGFVNPSAAKAAEKAEKAAEKAEKAAKKAEKAKEREEAKAEKAAAQASA